MTDEQERHCAELDEIERECLDPLRHYTIVDLDSLRDYVRERGGKIEVWRG